MVGSKRTFEYVLKPDTAEDAERLFARAKKILGYACEGDDRIECHGITGEGVGAITLNLTIRARDQWACRALAQEILNHVTWGLAKGATDLTLGSRRQEAHTHRGYSHGRTKTFREPRSQPPPPRPRPQAPPPDPSP